MTDDTCTLDLDPGEPSASGVLTEEEAERSDTQWLLERLRDEQDGEHHGVR